MHATPHPKGKVYLVGAGPGVADLLTLRAARLLEQADIVFYDALVNPEILALAVKAKKFAVGKRCGQHSTAQHFINKRLIDAAREHAVIVRLKGGDPMLFARAQEEIDALNAAGIEYEVVPGITAALAASADLGVSLTRRAVSRSVTFATPRIGTYEAGADEVASGWIASVMAADTAVLYMAAGEAGEIAHQLIALGKPLDWPVAIVRDASSAEVQTRFMTLADLANGLERDERPVILMLGNVYREALDAASEPSDASGSDQDQFIWPILINQQPGR